MIVNKSVLKDVDRVGVEKLTLTNFRSYDNAKIETSLRPVVLCGPNGAGKTNVLEALSYLMPGKGMRSARLSDITLRKKTDSEADYNSRLWSVFAKVSRGDEELNVGTGVEKIASPDGNYSERRIVKINGEQAKSQGELGNVLTTVWLTPAMDRLFKGGSAPRRSFLDRLVYAFDTEHAKRTAAYEHSLKEWTKLLKEGRKDGRWLSALEQNMGEQGIAVAAARREHVARLEKFLNPDAENIFPRAEIKLDGLVETWLDTMPALEAEEKLKEQFVKNRNLVAMNNNVSPDGVHKSDLQVLHKDKGLPAETCSTGEQKALLIAIILAQATSQALNKGFAPILLLDEVAAHLDEKRRDALFDRVCNLNAQAWITGTDVDMFKKLQERADFFHVEDAKLKRIV